MSPTLWSLVRLVVKNGGEDRVAKDPTSTLKDAKALAESIRGYIEAGYDLSFLLGEEPV